MRNHTGTPKPNVWWWTTTDRWWASWPSGLARRWRYRARRGVVLTAGGFVFNDEMLRRHAPPLVRGNFKVGTEGDDGRGIRMAQALGASVRNMYSGDVSLPFSPPRNLIHGILVNGQGQRFINEDTYMGRIGQSALYGQDGEIYLVVDEATYEVNWMGLAASWVCETTAELESEIGLPTGALQATVDLYNHHAETGPRPHLPQGRCMGATTCPAARRLRSAHCYRAVRALHAGWT